MEGKEVMVIFIVVVFSIHGDPWNAMDSCNGGSPVHPTFEGQILNRARYFYSKGKPVSG